MATDIALQHPAISSTREEPAFPTATSTDVGQVWSLDASGLDPERLAGEAGVRALQGLFDALIEALDLHPVAAPIWHLFGGEHAGVTGIVALSESHLACHSFPEHAGITLDLYTCTSRPAPDWERLLGQHLGGEGSVRLEQRVFRRSLRHSSLGPSRGPSGDQESGPAA